MPLEASSLRTTTTGSAPLERNRAGTAEELRMHILKGNRDGVQTAIKSGVSVDTSLKGEWSPLMYACSLAHPEIVECLLKHGANPNFNRRCFTPLMAACTSGKNEEKLLHCIELLINNGANVNAVDRSQQSALMYAAREGNAKITKFLIKKNADIYLKDNRGWNALFWAIHNGHTGVVKCLLEAGCLQYLQEAIDLNGNNNEQLKQIDSLYNGCDKKNSMNGLNGMNHEISSVLKLNQANKSVNDILNDGLRLLTDLERRLYQDCATVSLIRFKLNTVVMNQPPVAKIAIKEGLRNKTLSTLRASECVHNHLKYLQSFTLKLTDGNEVVPANILVEKKTSVWSENWSTIIVTTLIVTVTLWKTKLFRW